MVESKYQSREIIATRGFISNPVLFLELIFKLLYQESERMILAELIRNSPLRYCWQIKISDEKYEKMLVLLLYSVMVLPVKWK